MKKSVLKITALSSLLLSAATLAAPSAEIKVTGELITPTCDVTLDKNGVFDYGKINQTLINDKQATSLGNALDDTVKVQCSAPTLLTFKLTDNRLGTASMAGNKYFGLGNVNGNGKLGYYTLKGQIGYVDGEPASIIVVSPNGTISSAPQPSAFEHDQRLGWRKMAYPTELAVGKNFELPLNLEAFLAKKSEMQGGISEDVNLDGSATIEFGFGI
ncbi:TPA: DUF1120 domain-containing protein [Serratia fonticola]|uniref:DUF1120 domain-containing protein n=1 Tax=Serratia fonticola TaxID=47917 RepID=UPI00217BC094|nr:DUF1120 domain-containing protein [Serratia fonticola]CAI1517301.1 Protein of uncharacterised function (DUF1120) [Serratia fonticola]